MADAPVALGGVMGATRTRVTALTKNVFPRSGALRAVGDRGRARKLGMQTDAVAPLRARCRSALPRARSSALHN
jgi:phenylalanyl-tRNA synthetase beta subunit